MKKGLKITLKIVGVLVVLLLLAAGGGWWYMNAKFLDFEGDYPEPESMASLSVDGQTFSDRNGNGTLDVYEDFRQPLDRRVEDLLSQMTQEEKLHLLKGSGLASAMGRIQPGTGIPGAVGTIVPTPRLGIPTVYLSDGPAGLRIQPTREGEDRTYYATAFPIGTMLASTWNTELVQAVGEAMGNEAKEYGLDVILGPGANIHRHPFCGRNFEYYSEDPVLTGYIGAAMVNGIESNGVGTSVKHFVANNQETNRNWNDARVSDRAMREIYLKGFEIIVRESQPWTLMSSYNKVNGTFVAESPDLLTDILRGEWGFEGLVMSDWFGGNDAPAMIRAGNDLLEPGTKLQWDTLVDAAEDGTLSMEAIDTSVRRILRLILGSWKMQEGATITNNPDLETHAAITRQSAAEGMVLLKNEGTLPLGDTQEIALLGVVSFDFIAGGTGSGDVNEAYTVSLDAGLRNSELEEEGTLARGRYTIQGMAKDLFDAHKAANPEAFVKPEGLEAMFQPYRPPEIPYTREQMEQMAQQSDVAVITIGRNSGEGGDRVEQGDFLLTGIEQEMIRMASEAFHAAGKKVVVILNVGGVIETASWKDQADAILLAWQGGQEGGNAVADVLSGKITPSGKLPMTFPVHVADHASHANFPLDGRPMKMTDMLLGGGEKPEAEWEKDVDYTNYEEGIYVGYRHFDKAGMEVSFPFGYGGSYTTFELDSLSTTLLDGELEAKLVVRNTGPVQGKEVVQLYIAKPGSAADRPERELKAFGKTRNLAPGASQVLEFRIPLEDLRIWDEAQSQWVLEPGAYLLEVGVSSRDIQMTAEVDLVP